MKQLFCSPHWANFKSTCLISAKWSRKFLVVKFLLRNALQSNLPGCAGEQGQSSECFGVFSFFPVSSGSQLASEAKMQSTFDKPHNVEPTLMNGRENRKADSKLQ